ncbi:DUF4105 domain-containing protein [Luteolibacter ambystomatis]|uniref:DUF4105 domain-containing protein n=1 Tax=Luteolibacter ambystomatis TaxID=2824561 RepID=A0A975J2D2_9BACT|nr:DUF4105 domain-containing protein [Luteolibacter ambystomatis]QUE52768.1 DUF4105 domain-containing protein [Luteolibacter ambystomatis]
MPRSPVPALRTILRGLLQGLVWLALAIGVAWTFGALWFDSIWRGFAVLFLLAAVAALFRFRPLWKPQAGVAGTIVLVIGWWLTVPPKQDRDWKPEVARLASARIDADEVVIQNVRNFDYRTETDFTPRYETRTYHLSQLRGIDLFVNYWGSKWMAHPIVSFDFGGEGRVCFSIETRPEKGEGFSALGGLYRQFELICVVADERDVIRVRTNYRHGEDVYLYHFNATPEQARKSFGEYLATLNHLATHPRWYNAVTDNCTSAIRHQRVASERSPWDWRMLVNGFGDEMLYERGALDRSIPFPELKSRGHINDRAKAADQSPDFSKLIREGVPGC